MAKTLKTSAELHALIWEGLGVPTSSRGADLIKINRLNETWRATATVITADPEFREKVVSVSISLSETYDLAE